ncbi:MAG: hypothetical protein ABIA97_01620 [Candidatus Omnitrophota bacterium]
MKKNFLNCSSLQLLVLLLAILFFCGCETWEGLKRDIDTLRGWDADFQEVFW